MNWENGHQEIFFEESKRAKTGHALYLGMIEREPRARGELRQHYTADRTNPLWSIIDTALVAANPEPALAALRPE